MEANFEGIYILTNPSFKEFVKIGKATEQTIAQRVRTLNSSSAVPFSFNIYATYQTTNGDRIEKMLHKILDKFKYELRAREKTDSGRERVREFFAMEASEAFEYLIMVAEGFGDEHNVKSFKKTKKQLDEEKVAQKIETRTRAANFSFERKGIKPGTMIEFLRDSNLKAKVLDDKYIEFEGERYSLTGLAKKFLGKVGVVGEVAGPRFFRLGGKILAELPDIG